MAIHKQTADRLEKFDPMLDAVFQLLPVGETVRDFTAQRLGDVAGARKHAATHITNDFIALGILMRHGPEYGTPANGMTPGRHYHYTLLVDRVEAQARVEAFKMSELERAQAIRAAAGRKTSATKKASASKVTIAPEKSHEEVRAIAGPDLAPGLERSIGSDKLAELRASRKDDSAALVEAARQFNSRDSRISEQLDAFEATAKELGITFDRDIMLQSIQMESDERLETISLVLPYIDRLERETERMAKTIEALQKERRDFDKLNRDYNALKSMWEQAISQKVTASDRISSSH